MNNNELISNIKYYQLSGVMHPITCGNNSKHELLIPILENNNVILKCIDCDYVQKFIPKIPSIDEIKLFEQTLLTFSSQDMVIDELEKDKNIINNATNAVKKKFQENVVLKGKCCWENLEIAELTKMLEEHIQKFKDRGGDSKSDAVDLIGISMMIFEKSKY